MSEPRLASDWVRDEMRKLAVTALRWHRWRWLPWAFIVRRRLAVKAQHLHIMLEITTRHERFQGRKARKG